MAPPKKQFKCVCCGKNMIVLKPHGRDEIDGTCGGSACKARLMACLPTEKEKADRLAAPGTSAEGAKTENPVEMALMSVRRQWESNRDVPTARMEIESAVKSLKDAMLIMEAARVAALGKEEAVHKKAMLQASIKVADEAADAANDPTVKEVKSMEEQLREKVMKAQDLLGLKARCPLAWLPRTILHCC